MLGVILAAGRGTRMGALTAETPKPMLVLWNKPILEHIVRAMRDGGITDIVVVVGYRADQVRRYFGDGARFGVRIRYVCQRAPKGQAHALRRAAPLIGDNTFVLQMGDVLVPSWWYGTLAYALNGSWEGILTIDYKGNTVEGAGIDLDEFYGIHDIVEKPSSAQRHDWNNSGILALRPSVFHSVPQRFRGDSEMYITDIVQKRIQNRHAWYRGLPITAPNYLDVKDKAAFERLSRMSRPAFLKE